MADKPRSSSGGVKNLRAMFEQNNKDEVTNSPPDRGRSPAASLGGGSNGTSPRPLSKVRTSFVTVERSGQFGPQWGLKRENSSGDTSMANQRGSFSIDEEADPEAVKEQKTSVAAEYLARRKSQALTETVPEFAVVTPPIEAENRLGYKSTKSSQAAVPAASKPSPNPDKKTSVEDTHGRLLPGDPTSRAAVSGGAALNGSAGFGETLNGNMSGKLNTTSGLKNGQKASGNQISSRPSTTHPAEVSSTATSTRKSSTRPSDVHSNGHTTANSSLPSKPVVGERATARIQAQKEEAARKAEKHKSPTTATAPARATTGRPSTSSSTNTTATKKSGTTSIGGFVKPRPKSPTRPVKLPASMTTHTASSLSKVAAGSANANGDRRASLVAPIPKTTSRSPSRASLAPNTADLRRKSSSFAQRPSFGPPPVKKQPSRQSLARAPTPADEGFLARMMRPTQSSASKTHEKVSTPPRSRPATRPTTRDGSGQHKGHEVSKGSPAAKKTPVSVAPSYTGKENKAHHEEAHIPKVAETTPVKHAKAEHKRPVTPKKAEHVAVTTPVKTDTVSSAEPASHADNLEAVESAKEAISEEISVDSEAKQESAAVNTDTEPVLPSKESESESKADISAPEEVTVKTPSKVEAEPKAEPAHEESATNGEHVKPAAEEDVDADKAVEEKQAEQEATKEEGYDVVVPPAEQKLAEIVTPSLGEEADHEEDETAVKDEEEEVDA